MVKLDEIRKALMRRGIFFMEVSWNTSISKTEKNARE